MGHIEHNRVEDNIQIKKENTSEKSIDIDWSKISKEEADFILSLSPEFIQEKEELLVQDITKRASLAQEINTDLTFDWESVKNQVKKLWENTGEAMKKIWNKLKKSPSAREFQKNIDRLSHNR